MYLENRLWLIDHFTADFGAAFGRFSSRWLMPITLRAPRNTRLTAVAAHAISAEDTSMRLVPETRMFYGR